MPYSPAASSDLLAQLADFSSASRLYALTLPNQPSVSLAVEAFTATEALHSVGARDLIVLSTDAQLQPNTLLGQTATLHVSLSDGSRTTFTGLVSEVAKLGTTLAAQGSLSRLRLRVVPWIWLLSHTRNSRSWQDQTAIQIVDTIFQAYNTEHGSFAAWRWSDDVAPYLQALRPRSYCAQYRESDLHFVSRLLAEEGLSWRVEESEDAPSGHQIVLFADTTHNSATPQDATSAHALGGIGIRFHGARSMEEQDSVQALLQSCTLQSSRVTLQSFDYKAKQSVSTSIASTPSNRKKGTQGGTSIPQLERYDSPGMYAFATPAEARHYAERLIEASEARSVLWQARTSVRTLRPGTRFTLSQGPLAALTSPTATATAPSNQPDPAYVVLAVTSVGINNLPRPTQEALDALFGPIPELMEELIEDLQAKSASSVDATCGSSYTSDSNTVALTSVPLISLHTLITQAQRLGYANRIDMVGAEVPWRPVLADGTGLLLNPRRTAFGSQTATVVGPHGQATPNGADEIYTDKLGRIRIRFHWQEDSQDGAEAASTSSTSTAWVRVLQRSAGGGSGAGRGLQFIPRIGQEVLVQFIEGDIDRPIVTTALYNGQGEGGVAPSPAGDTSTQADTSVFDVAHDHRYSGQGNLIAGMGNGMGNTGTGGHSPVWHGAAANSHRNPSAQWGIRSKEFGAPSGSAGYNQLVFDDTDNQGRIQLKTTQDSTELNLGHLIHTADNYRGSLRGTGAELRTDAYGAIRAGAGLLISSYQLQHNARHRDPAGDNSAGMALLKQASTLAGSFSQAASTHRSVGYASHLGTTSPNASSINTQAAPLKALHTSASGLLNPRSLEQALADAAAKQTSTADGPDGAPIPHSTDPLIHIAARGGLGTVAGQSIQLSNGETLSLMSGQDSQYSTGGALRVHSGQAIGILAGAVQAGSNNTGLQLIAAQDDIDLQAQADTLQVQAKDQISVQSANAHIDWAAAKKISISTAGGANITIEGGNITTQAPGQVTVHAGAKVFEGPGRVNYPMPTLPRSICVECLKKSLAAAPAFTTVG